MPRKKQPARASARRTSRRSPARRSSARVTPAAGGKLTTRQVVLWTILAVVVGAISYEFGGSFLKTSLFTASQKQTIVSIARAQLGKPYVLGATGPNSFDCSGLAKYVLKNAVNVDLPRVSRDQAKVGRPIELSNVGPGDLVFFATGEPGRVSHVGIVVSRSGDVVKMINANSVDMVMKEEVITTGYWKRTFMFAREITEFTKDDVADNTAYDTTANTTPPAPDVAYSPSVPSFPPSEVVL